MTDPLTKCDGNHGGPRCADPECWNTDLLPSKPVSPLADRLGFIAKYLERPGASPEEIVMSVTVEEGAQRLERLREALTEALAIFEKLGYAEDDEVSNTASRGVYVTAKALTALESRDG